MYKIKILFKNTFQFPHERKPLIASFLERGYTLDASQYTDIWLSAQQVCKENNQLGFRKV